VFFFYTQQTCKNLFSGKKKKEKNEKKTLPSAQIQDTRQRKKIFFLGKKEKKKIKIKTFAECPDLGHSAK